jgi:hypothetical protein
MKMKRLILTLALAAVAIAGCAHLKEGASGGASAVEQQNPQNPSPYPKTYSNDHYYPL